MILDDLIELLIPGYQSLNAEEKGLFLASEAGIALSQVLHPILNRIHLAEIKSRKRVPANKDWAQTLWKTVQAFAFEDEGKILRENALEELKEQKLELFLDLKERQGYQDLLHAIENTAKEHAKKKRAEELLLFMQKLNISLPWLNHKDTTEINSAFEDLKDICLNAIDHDKELNFVAEARQIIESCLLELLNAANGLNLPGTDFNALHQRQAKQGANLIVEALLNGNDISQSIKNWMDDYERDLSQIIVSIFAKLEAEGEDLDLTKASSLDSSTFTLASQCFQGLLSTIITEEEKAAIKQKLNEFADVHAAIQAIGFATQNESSLLAFLDLCNYGRYYQRFAENKAIISSLLSFLDPILLEYKDIAQNEKNPLLKFIRMFMPMLVVLSTVLFTASLLSPLALPELTFIALIPAIFLGLNLSALCIQVKNDVYKYVRNNINYDGPYATPKFYLSPRLISVLNGNKELAEVIRNFYIEEFKCCDAREEKLLKEHQEKGGFNSEQKKAWESNLERRIALAAEWYDINNNTKLVIADKLAIDKIADVIIRRLDEDKHPVHAIFAKELQKDERSVGLARLQLIEKLKAWLDPNQTAQELKRPSQIGFFSSWSHAKPQAELKRLAALENEVIRSKHAEIDYEGLTYSL